ncbi:MAG: hypothetical protein WCG48_03915 [Candidatus Berkelbacteria bacterium]
MSQFEDEKYGYKNRAGRSVERGNKRENALTDMLGEVPIVGELVESISFNRIGKKGMKKFCCCCGPFFILLIVGVVTAIWWVIQGGLSILNLKDANFSWLLSVKTWFVETFQLEQFFNLSSLTQSIIGL